MANYIIEIPIIHETFVTDNEEAGKAIEAICHPSCDDEFTVSDYYDLTPEAKAVVNQFAKWNTLWVDDFGYNGCEKLVTEKALFEMSEEIYKEYLDLYKVDECSIEDYLKDSGCYVFEIEEQED